MTAMFWIFISMLFFAAGEAASKYWVTKQYWWLVLVAIAFYIVCEIPWLIAIKEKDHLTSLGTIWCVGAVITTVMIGTLVFKEAVSLSQWVGIILAIISCWLLNR